MQQCDLVKGLVLVLTLEKTKGIRVKRRLGGKEEPELGNHGSSEG